MGVNSTFNIYEKGNTYVLIYPIDERLMTGTGRKPKLVMSKMIVAGPKLPVIDIKMTET